MEVTCHVVLWDGKRRETALHAMAGGSGGSVSHGVIHSFVHSHFSGFFFLGSIGSVKRGGEQVVLGLGPR